jgi:hypothetical protein
MRNGEVAIASVTGQANRALARDGSNSWLTYRFEDTHGIKYQGACTDSSRELFVGIGFLVFCDREQPHRRLASCESDFEVALPREE